MPHQPLLNLLLWQLDVSGARAAGRTSQYAPLSFDPSFLEMFSDLECGWHAGAHRGRTAARLPRRWPGIIERERIERLYITPAALHQLADAAETLGSLAGVAA